MKASLGTGQESLLIDCQKENKKRSKKKRKNQGLRLIPANEKLLEREETKVS